MSDAHVFPIKWCKFRSSDTFLIDANVWVLLNGPSGLKRDIAVEYSSALHKMLAAQCKLFVDVLVLSEFVNRYSRYKFVMWKPTEEVTFKDFRSSTDYPPVARDIADAVRGILGMCQLVGPDLESIDLEALLSDFEENRRDINDQLLAEMCRSKNLTLITHDRDFKGYEITVFTANPRMLEPENETAIETTSH